MKRIEHKLFLLAALAILAGACTSDNGQDATINPGERLVTLALSVPGTPASRGLGADENAIKSVDVLLFTTGTDYFYYRAVGTIDKVSNDKFTVRLPEDTWNVVVLANAREALNDASYPHKSLLTPATPAPGGSTVTRADVLDNLLLHVTEKWPEGGTFKGIPMWGYYNDLLIGAGTASPVDVDPTRAIARVNISLSTEAEGNFALASARLYNYSRAGSIAPAVHASAGANVDGYEGEQWQYVDDHYKAVATHLPEFIDPIPPLKTFGPIVYDIDPAPADPVYKYKEEIYTFEAGEGKDETLDKNTCLVIGGYYKESGAPTYPTDATYYRVDFIKGDGTTYLPLLRNHSYNVVIKSVDGEGEPTAAGAFSNRPVNLLARVLEWEDGGIGDIVFDGQN
ncbi:MAG: hypothetical protein LBK12_08250, partial [Odoribacteraceae bacterium]|nr:hypothetical protein [Odoribacteraceae bacterium]